ncbi:transmembrane protein 272-like isoform X2 [Penaeus chinensis]|uniref:transmembrane protein 272-like isoform X2 n=1 Tax=Penaeus chinensis TaxID=139456 RepID=UPI001FB76916|nr:transmembrane protein 272-like isoform X2 [Penaeus chinensis]XP_047487402.1 transmembrane protein 272-like isoform X2 [Penaeus chinensis]
MAEQNINGNPVQGDAEQGQAGAEKQGKGIAQVGIVLGGVVMGLLMVAFALLSLGLTIAFITVGAIYQDDCNVEPMIPVWLIVQGVVSFILTLSGKSQNSKTNPEYNLAKMSLTMIVQVFAFGWFIIGNVWVFTAWAKNPDFEDLTQANSCQKGLFYLALYGGIIIPYAGLALALTIITCVYVCTLIAKNN